MATVVVQVTNDGDLDHSAAMMEMRCGFRCTSKTELIPVRSHVYVIRRQESRVTHFWV